MKKEKALLLVVSLSLLLLATTQAQTNNQTVPTTVNVPYYNLPPALAQNIPNQTWTMNTNRTNAIRLEDYFSDNETLSFTNTSVQNITITISQNSSGSFVSFYSQPNFIGTRNVTFYASDGNNTPVASNVVFLHVVNDTEPPRWSNPFTYPTNIYQNTEVDFYTTWTDNVELKSFTFGIREYSSWVTYTRNFSGTNTTAGFGPIQISNNAGKTVFWYFSARDIAGNENTTELQNFTIKSVDEITQNETNESTRTPSGEPTPDVKEQLEKIRTFKIQPEDGFRLELKQGEKTTISIKITSTANEDLTFNTRIGSLEEFTTTLDKEKFTLAPEESITVTVEIGAGRLLSPDLYFGTWYVITGGATIRIPVVIQVVPFISKYALSLTIPEEYKRISPGESVKGIVKIANLEDIEEKKVKIYYAIADYGGRITDANEEEMTFNQKELSHEVYLTTTPNTPLGEYIMYARSQIEEEINLASDDFAVGKKIDLATFLRENILWIILLLILVSIVIFVVRAYNDKERLRLLNLYLMIQELRSKVAENKMDAAINVFIKIKQAYGEPLKITLKENRAELIEEIKKFVKRAEVLGEYLNVKEETEIKPETPQAVKEESKVAKVKNEPQTTTKEEQRKLSKIPEEKSKIAEKNETPQAINKEPKTNEEKIQPVESKPEVKKEEAIVKPEENRSKEEDKKTENDKKQDDTKKQTL
jgi:hypothetical protein